MSNRSSHYPEHSHPHQPHRHGHAPTRRPAAPATAVRQRARPSSAYVIAHAGKQIRIGPVIVWIVIGTVTALGAWSAATATYFTFRDDVLTRLLARQAEMQYSYEDRIAELRARIDRTTSRQLLDQEQFEQKLDQIIQRQAALDQRTAALGSLPDNSATGSVKPAARSLTERLFGKSKPAPLPENTATPPVQPDVAVRRQAGKRYQRQRHHRGPTGVAGSCRTASDGDADFGGDELRHADSAHERAGLRSRPEPGAA